METDVNDAAANEILDEMVKGANAYASDHQGLFAVVSTQYTVSAGKAYWKQDYCDAVIKGYKFTCDFSNGDSEHYRFFIRRLLLILG